MPLSPGKKLLFRLVALILLPAMLIGGLEAVLRIAGYGHSYRLFKPVHKDGKDYFINDDNFTREFFPPEMTRSTSSFQIEAKKPPGTCRIFILGESAAMGDPEPAYGPGRYLEALLREKHPGQKFEIINLGITAINSHVILPIAREAAHHDGDLWLVYMGNNEMVGPYGAATVFGSQAPPVGFVRLSLALKRSRIGQLFLNLAAKISNKPEDSKAWGGMEMFVNNKVGVDDPRRLVVYDNFRKNLKDIVNAGVNSGAKVLLSTVAVNLKDCPPFATMPPTNYPPAEAALFQKHFEDGLAAEKNGQYVEAEKQFAAAEATFHDSADLEYKLAQTYLLNGKKAEAKSRFIWACDFDTLTFRADTQINQPILNAGKAISPDKLHILDSAGELAEQAADGINGAESFYEHVHFNFDGSYRMGKLWAAQIENLLPPAIASQATPGWALQEICERRLGLTDWNRAYIMESVIPRFYSPPLNGQSNNAARIEALQAQIKKIRARMDTNDQAEARAIYADALKRNPDDYFIHENYALFLQVMNDIPGAVAEERRAVELVPQDFVANFLLGKLLALQGRLDEAETVLSHALESHPGFTEAWVELAGVHAAKSKLELARSEYERARKLRPDDPAIPYQLGKVLSRLKLSAESLQSFRDAVQMKPDYWEAHYTLGGELGTHDKFPEAAEQFAEVVRLKPEFPGGHLNLGVALLKLGKSREAAQQFEETLRLDPADKTAAGYLAQTRAIINHKQ